MVVDPGGFAEAMKSLFKKRCLWLTLIFAVFFVSISYLNNSALYPSWSSQLSFLSPVLDVLQLPAVFVGILVSKNAEAPNAIAAYITLFITYIIIFAALIILFRFLSLLIRKRVKN